MALSKEARRAYKKAVKTKKKKKKGNWLFIKKGDSGKEVFSKLVTQLAVIVLIGCGVVLGNELRLSLSAKYLNSSLKELYYTYINTGTNNGKVMDSAEKMLKMNPDTVGWIQIDDTNISLPVVQRKGADGNSYYLKTAFDGSSNKAGTIFLDKRATLEAYKRSDNLVVYGHNQKDRTMFGDLAKYKHNVDFYKEQPIITFCSNYEVNQYKIFGYFVTPIYESQTADGVIFDYHNYINFDGKSEFNSYVDRVLERSQIVTDVDVKYGDELLTLSTCSNEFDPSRFVVVARKVRDGESAEVDVSKAYINENAKEPDWDVIYGR